MSISQVFETDHEAVYVVYTREFIGSNEEIYKIDITSERPGMRLREYPKGNVLKIHKKVNDSKQIEGIVLDQFAKKFIMRQDLGQEYFEGNFRDMEDELIKIVRDYEDKQVPSEYLMELDARAVMAARVAKNAVEIAYKAVSDVKKLVYILVPNAIKKAKKDAEKKAKKATKEAEKKAKNDVKEANKRIVLNNYFDEYIIKDSSADEPMTMREVYLKYGEWHTQNETGAKMPKKDLQTYLNERIGQSYDGWMGYKLKNCDIYDNESTESFINLIDQNI